MILASLSWNFPEDVQGFLAWFLRPWFLIIFSSVQLLSHVWLFAIPWTAAHQASLSITNSHSLLKVMSIESVMPSSHLILCHPFLFLPSIFPSIRVFPNESVLHIRWPKYWRFIFNINPSSEYSGLISFRIDWFELLAVQRTLKSFLQHHSSKASILRCSAFFIVQFSHLYMTTEKTIPLTRWTFVGKVISLLLNMLSRLAITFFPRSKGLNFMAAVTICSDFGAQNNKLCLCFHCLPIYLPRSDGTGCYDLVFWMLSFKTVFSHSSFTFIKSLFSSSSLYVIRVVSSALSAVVDISPGNLDSSLCFFQPSVSHDVLCI